MTPGPDTYLISWFLVFLWKGLGTIYLEYFYVVFSLLLNSLANILLLHTLLEGVGRIILHFFWYVNYPY